MRRLAALILTAVCSQPVAAGAAAPTLGELRAELGIVDKQVYESLERHPVRGWGDQATLGPLFRLRSDVRRAPADGDGRRLVRSLPVRAAAIFQAFVRQLRLEPAAAITFDGSATAAPARPTVTAFVNVPTAIVLALGPAPAGGSLDIRAARADGLAIDGQQLRLGRRFAQFAVLPLLATGAPGKRTVTLKLAVGRRESAVPLVVDVRASGRLTGKIADKQTDRALAAKLFVEDDAGRLYVVPGEPNYRTQSWYAPWQPRFCYVQGRFSLPLPPGRYRVTAMKGCAWRNEQAHVEVRAGLTTTLPIRMAPLRRLAEEGWLCGDMHVHYRGGPTLAQLRAEDVNVAANTLYSSRRAVPLPFYDRRSDATHLNTSDQEIEHWNFGNTFYFNIPRTVLDPQAGQRELTPMFHYDEQAHAMGGITLRWLRARPFAARGGGQQQPELAVNAALGHMDVWSVLDNSMQELLDNPRRKWTGSGWGGRLYEHTYRTWYALLNCGLRIPAAAGTSYGRLSRLGFNRVYARVRGRLTNASWARGLKRGDGFVTNGPLLWLRGGQRARLPGDEIDLARAGELPVTVELVSRHPVRLVELLRNGEVIASKRVDDAAKPLTWRVTAQVTEPSWFAARCFGRHEPRYAHTGAHNQFAHTSPLFVTIAGRRPASPADAARFVREIDALIAFAPNLPTEQMRTRALAVYREARQYYAAMASRKR